MCQTTGNWAAGPLAELSRRIGSQRAFGFKVNLKVAPWSIVDSKRPPC